MPGSRFSKAWQQHLKGMAAASESMAAAFKKHGSRFSKAWQQHSKGMAIAFCGLAEANHCVGEADFCRRRT